MDSNICFEMSLFVVEAIRGRCARFIILTATVSEICGGQTNVPILVVYIVLYCIVLYCIVLHCIALHCIALHRIVSYRIVSYRIASHRIASHRIASHRIASHRIASHCIVLYCVALRCAVLCCAVLCCAVLHRTAPHCTAPQCIALHCNAMQCTAPRRVASHRVCRVVSCRVVSCRVVSFRVVSCRIVSDIVSHRIASCRIVSHRIVSHRIPWTSWPTITHDLPKIRRTHAGYGEYSDLFLNSLQREQKMLPHIDSLLFMIIPWSAAYLRLEFLAEQYRLVVDEWYWSGNRLPQLCGCFLAGTSCYCVHGSPPSTVSVCNGGCQSERRSPVR